MSTFLEAGLMAWATLMLIGLAVNRVLERARPSSGEGKGRISGGRLVAVVAPLGPMAVPAYLWRARGRKGVALATAAGLGALHLSLWVACVAQLRAWRAPVLSRRIAAMAAVLADGRWDRPVLRGGAVDCNGVELARPALATLDSAPADVKSLTGEARVTLAHERKAALDQLRESTRCAWSWAGSATASRDDASPGTDGERLGKAAWLLGALAEKSTPAECLRISTDTIRLGQDLAAGGDLGETVAAGMIDKDIAATALTCSYDASEGERETAAKELGTLAAREPPAAHGLAADSLFLARAAQSSARLAPTWPRPMGDWLAWDEVFDAGNRFLDESPTWLETEPLASPAGLARARHVAAARLASTNGLVRSAGANMKDSLLTSYVRGQAYLRMAALLFEGKVIESRSGAMPSTAPDAATNPELADPFDAAPLHWEHRKEGIMVWSVGDDGIDQGVAPRSDDLWFFLPDAATTPR